MLVQQFSHEVTVPTDPQSGQPSGQRAHKAFKFTVALNKAVPLLYNALASGEMLPTVTMNWYRTSIEGKQEHHFTHVLTDATIVNIDCKMPHCQDSASQEFTQLIEVSLSYRKIDWNNFSTFKRKYQGAIKCRARPGFITVSVLRAWQPSCLPFIVLRCKSRSHSPMCSS
ncbi:MAG: hcp-2 hemolysin-coregulated protein [Osedax symbiont Rs1]|nr:MAG: hcp-2 hemolysin-coregulated protein [Osedax symbiont Rs1]